MTVIIAIPLIHLDTGHIIEMVHWRRGDRRESSDRLVAYAAISRAITSGRMQLLFNPASCLEWVEGAEESRSWRELSEFFETAALVKEVDTSMVYLAELIEEVRRHFPNLSLPTIPVVRPVGEVPAELLEVARHHPELRWMDAVKPMRSRGASAGVKAWVEGSAGFAHRNKKAMQERVNGWRTATLATREEFRRNRAKYMTQSAKMEWANRAQHLAEVLASSDPGVDQDRLAEIVDFNRLPACALYLNALWRYAKAMGDGGPDDNDVDDWLQVPAIAYSDFALIERRLRNHLVSGTPAAATRIFYDPVDFGKMVPAVCSPPSSIDVRP